MSPASTQDSIRATPLEQLAALASRAGGKEIETEAISLADRISEGRFYLACIGQFKRGKSSLLDALLGDTILPIGVVPVTALPTVVRYGPERAARVLLRDSEWRHIEMGDLALYVSEEDNPGNEKEVAAVEVFFPSDLLATGMCLVDTPGLGSVFEGNTATTYKFLPHIDAALVVLGADPPISGEELALVTRISREIDDVVFVLNKADRVTRGELAAAKQFAGRMLGERLGRPIEIYEVSAKEELAGNHGTRDWAGLTGALEKMLSLSGHRLVRRAQQRGASRLASWLSGTIEEEKRALTEPLAESEARMRALTEYVAQSEQSIRDLELLFLGEQQRLTERLEARRQAFLTAVLPEARHQLAEKLAPARLSGPAYRRFAMQAALDVARAQVVPWLKVEEEAVNAEYDILTGRFTSLANEFLGQLATLGIPHLAYLAGSIEGCGKLTSRSTFQFNSMLYIARPASPLRHAADIVLALLGLGAVIRGDAENFLVRLLNSNTSRVQADLEDRLAVARRELEHAVRATLVRARGVAVGTLLRARETRDAGEAAVQAQLAHFAEIESEIASLSQEMSLMQAVE